MTIFISKIQNYCTFIIVKGVRKQISFQSKGAPFHHGYFISTNDELSRALTHHPDYGKIFFKQEDDAPSQQQAAEEVHTFAAVYEDVKRTQDANAILVKEYGVSKDRLKSKADAIKAAEELNISFPNLK